MEFLKHGSYDCFNVLQCALFAQNRCNSHSEIVQFESIKKTNLLAKIQSNSHNDSYTEIILLWWFDYHMQLTLKKPKSKQTLDKYIESFKRTNTHTSILGRDSEPNTFESLLCYFFFGSRGRCRRRRAQRERELEFQNDAYHVYNVFVPVAFAPNDWIIVRVVHVICGSFPIFQTFILAFVVVVGVYLVACCCFISFFFATAVVMYRVSFSS